MMTIERYRQDMAPALLDVFYTSVRQGCKHHYSAEQLAAWAPESIDIKGFEQKMDALQPLIARLDSKIAGYADLQPSGLIDHFFVHGHCQKKRVGSALMHALLNMGANLPLLYSHVSLTAKPFFEQNGFNVVKQQTVNVNGVDLENYYMKRPQH